MRLEWLQNPNHSKHQGALCPPSKWALPNNTPNPSPPNPCFASPFALILSHTHKAYMQLWCAGRLVCLNVLFMISRVRSLVRHFQIGTAVVLEKVDFHEMVTPR